MTIMVCLFVIKSSSGGLSRISVDRVDDHGRAMSPILGAAELFNCPHSANSSIKLPDYPLGKVKFCTVTN